MIQARLGLAAMMVLVCCSQLQARDPVASSSTVSKPAANQKFNITTTASGCCSQRAGTLVSRIMADLPQMTYRVDGLDTDSRETALGRAGDIGRMQFVVGDQVFNTETEANEAILVSLQQRLAEMRQIQYVVGDQRMTCPMSARALASVKGEDVRYHVAGIEFEKMQSAVAAEEAVRNALAQFVRENTPASELVDGAAPVNYAGNQADPVGSGSAGWSISSAQVTSAASATKRRSGADDEPRRYTPDDVIAATAGEPSRRAFVPPSRSTVAIRGGDGSSMMPSMDAPGNGILRGKPLVPPGGCPKQQARLEAQAASALVAPSAGNSAASSTATGCGKGTASTASAPTTSGCSKTATTVAATATGATTSDCCKKSGAATASAPATSGCSKSATTVAAGASSDCCKKATTVAAGATGGCSKTATTVAADASSECCKKAATVAAGATSDCCKKATTVAASATSDCCKKGSDCCKGKSADDCCKNKAATTVAAKADSDCCMKSGATAKSDCGKCPATQNVAATTGTSNAPSVTLAGVSSEEPNSEAAQYRAMIQRMVEAATTALQS